MIKSKIFELELKVEKQSTQIRSLAKTAIHLEEEIQKKSLKRLLGKPVDVPQELIKIEEEKSQNYNNPGVIMESVNHVMKHLFRADDVKSDLTKSSTVGIVTGALEDYFKGAK